MSSESQSREVTLEGTIERFTFRNPDSGWAVLKIAEETSGKTVTAVGPMAQLKEGQRLRIRGEVDSHPRFGEQVKVDTFEQRKRRSRCARTRLWNVEGKR